MISLTPFKGEIKCHRWKWKTIYDIFKQKRDPLCENIIQIWIFYQTTEFST